MALYKFLFVFCIFVKLCDPLLHMGHIWALSRCIAYYMTKRCTNSLYFTLLCRKRRTAPLYAPNVGKNLIVRRYSALLLKAVLSSDCSVGMSVHGPSHYGDPRLNGSRCWNTFCTIYDRAMFLVPRGQISSSWDYEFTSVTLNDTERLYDRRRALSLWQPNKLNLRG